MQPGQRVLHADFGEGVVVTVIPGGYLRAFFASGERELHADALQWALRRTEQFLENVAPGHKRLQKAWLHLEAHALPLMENSAALTAARIDLLPHQVVLTHRVATACPRRFLVADEVGLGKTIETALLLRELASRGELTRALMVVPAGLVNNWHRELNEIFHLNFEVFGSEGDVTDRKSNAFAKHDRLIASVDTLKRPARIRRLLEAPKWDLVVFDEAHHLSAYGDRKTANYKLAESLRDHARDFLLLSATPHQGDHYRFWMLIQLLNPTLFRSPDEMLEERHRLNSVVFRRTKADACTPDGSPLFARRWVHTESFTMSEGETEFYAKLREYLQDGFDLARKKGSEGHALGFVMTIFQKIAASSFAAVRSTLRRRQLMLTIHEALLKDQALDVDGHLELMKQAKTIIRVESNIPDTPLGNGEIDRILAELKYRLVRKLDEDSLAVAASSHSSEQSTIAGEEMATSAVAVSLPEERSRIATVLAAFPAIQETKVEKLMRALGSVWNQNPAEKVVIFATYLATVDLLAREIDVSYPGQGVVVLRGGDHGMKLAAEKRFRKADGPRVLICTAAGREGINLQFARILFNFDLPWNPMDLEQRIGRIHRYGQRDTAQVYNLVLSDTIEGSIFLLLTDKLEEIAKTLGKVDEQGNVTEDLRAQILGQLSDRLSYDQLYRNAISDPELRRTRQELEAAMSNANEARKVVYELFQDLDRFSLDDYQPLADIDAGKRRIVDFVKTAVELDGGQVDLLDQDRLRVTFDRTELRCTINRELARSDDTLELLGLDHPLVLRLLHHWRSISPAELGATATVGLNQPVVLTVWLIQGYQRGADATATLVPIAVDHAGKRVPSVEKRLRDCFQPPSDAPAVPAAERSALLQTVIEPALQRELQHRGIAGVEKSHAARLIAWVELK
ncbi:MAG: DEAD/DEAH box helicase [Planctomyces sp.]